jgi:hypothetical protein
MYKRMVNENENNREDGWGHWEKVEGIQGVGVGNLNSEVRWERYNT